jgi:DHA2 family multidrug resistance protein
MAAISRQAVAQAYLLASDDFFLFSAWTSVILMATVWIARKPKPLSGPVAAD